MRLSVFKSNRLVLALFPFYNPPNAKLFKCGIHNLCMELIKKIEEELLALNTRQRLLMLHEISYFIQSVAALKKAEGDKIYNPLDSAE